jgi:hypothetical protein
MSLSDEEIYKALQDWDDEYNAVVEDFVFDEAALLRTPPHEPQLFTAPMPPSPVRPARAPTPRPSHHPAHKTAHDPAHNAVNNLSGTRKRAHVTTLAPLMDITVVPTSPELKTRYDKLFKIWKRSRAA